VKIEVVLAAVIPQTGTDALDCEICVAQAILSTSETADHKPFIENSDSPLETDAEASWAAYDSSSEFSRLYLPS